MNACVQGARRFRRRALRCAPCGALWPGRALIIVLTAALALSACLPLFSWLTRPVYQPYVEGLFSISVQEDASGNFVRRRAADGMVSLRVAQNEGCDIYLCGYATRLRPAQDTSVLRISAKDYGPFRHVFCSPNSGQKDVLFGAMRRPARAMASLCRAWCSIIICCWPWRPGRF